MSALIFIVGTVAAVLTLGVRVRRLEARLAEVERRLNLVDPEISE